ncbi:glycyl-tRNA synthetase alpha subunit-domain-containing protein [Dunaliella salina]|uniref:glycine--tRNA ligase n=1 Tax=Dunaliella salina TaxID=3046 RepID=A0ABQ7H7X9_DUNSA|nr:glycyl-tRNA synthetase alpha subunit-domain-containing protein [Dunaliella salina]|eukprot:KAF5842959.1 glycyl-tRNA synthetase alpha subunit-domain-containing protein [Dunaliella salina]
MKFNTLHRPCNRLPNLLAQHHHPKAPRLSIASSLIRCSPINGVIQSRSRSRSTVLHIAPSTFKSSATDAAPTLPASAPSKPAQTYPPSTSSLTFQEAITRLQLYWSSRGCAIWLPHNTEVGAGTMNPATFLRVLGPEPWNVGYVEPSIRPDDSRYGDNPNRLQRHTQFQVILKPDPGNSQELYLGSLEALGIDTRKHDVRFVEDNWESPVLGAWGLGWEVWLDGMEVTQFTYFQQAGGKPLHAPAVEITYGLERILMALQGVSNFKDIKYNEAVSYGELFLQNEYEMSVYNLDKADVAGQRQRFELFESEARRLLAERLPVPAYDHLLKLSHCFNVLDARGAVGVTERANCFATLRALSREVTSLWLSRREELGHPLGVISPPTPPSPQQPKPVAGGVAAAPFVLEVGTEELPPEDLDAGLEQLRERVPALLQKLRLSFSGVRVEGTPRRMAVIVDGLATEQTTQESEVRGPPTKAAFAADGSPTKALEGFCKKNGVAPSDVTKQSDAKGVEYVFAKVKEVGRPAAEVLTEALPGLVSSLSFRKSMKWGAGDVTFSRPVRWLLALLGDTELPFVWGNLQAGRATRLLRNSEQPEAQVPSADAYESVLKAANISLEQDSRRSNIWEQVTAAAASMGGVVAETAGDDLLTEVTNLVESPTLVVGSFEPKFLNLPKEVLVMVMRKHQRYFPVVVAPGAPLLPAFITVANGSVDQDVVAAGNAAVLRARFEDATFFYEEDLKQPLEAFRPKLAGTIFHKDQGTLLDWHLPATLRKHVSTHRFSTW